MNTISLRTKSGGALGIALFLLSALIPAYAMAHNGVDHSTAAEALEHLHNGGTHPALDATCMATAVDVRETALMSAWSKLNTSLTSALTDRKAALVAAWNLSSQGDRAKALATAWKEWKADKKAAHTEFRNDRKAAWEAFKKTAKDSCKAAVPKDEVMEKSEKDSVAL